MGKQRTLTDRRPEKRRLRFVMLLGFLSILSLCAGTCKPAPPPLYSPHQYNGKGTVYVVKNPAGACVWTGIISAATPKVTARVGSEILVWHSTNARRADEREWIEIWHPIGKRKVWGRHPIGKLRITDARNCGKTRPTV